MLYLGCTAGVLAGAARAASDGLPTGDVAAATTVLLVPALAGARLLFVARHLDRYRGDPRRIWRRADGGAALYGGLLLALPVSIPVLAAWDLPFWGFWDAAAVTMLVGLIFTRFGCLANGCCAGRPTSGPLGLRLADHRGVVEPRIPAPLLEAGWAAVVLAGALALDPARAFPGATFAAVVAAYAAGRLVLESLRAEAGEGRAPHANALISAALLAGAAALAVAAAA